MKKRFVELEGEIEGKDSKIDLVSKARDKYREQVLVLKQEIKVLKKELGHEMSSVSLTEDSVLATDRDGKNNEASTKFEQLLYAQNMQRKNQAI
jgi:cell division septum initiation protein DivIVA